MASEEAKKVVLYHLWIVTDGSNEWHKMMNRDKTPLQLKSAEVRVWRNILRAKGISVDQAVFTPIWLDHEGWPVDPVDKFVAANAQICPACGSTDLDPDQSIYSEEPGIATHDNACKSCGIEWQAIYTLTGYSITPEEKRWRSYTRPKEGE